MENPSLNQESIENALDQLSQWFPEQAANINKYEDQLVQNILDNTTPEANTPLGKLAVKSVADAALPVVNPAVAAAANSKTAKDIQGMVIPGVALSQFEDNELLDLSFLYTPCNLAIAGALVNSGFFVLSLVGLRASATDKLTRLFLEELGPSINGFARLLENFKTAEGTYEKAKAFFKIAGGLYKASGFKVLIKAWAEQAEWYDWVVTGALAIAQLTAWLATDGIAFIAEVALSLGSAGAMVVSIANAVNTCMANNAPAPVTVKFTPAGSYAYTASNIKVTLSASCKNITGLYVDSQLDITELSRNVQIDNNNGRLQVSKVTGNPAATFSPQGSYASPSQSVKVTLSADCKTMNGNTVSSSIDITNLPVGKEIANINGVLTAV
jgi:hypothetical protein